MKKEKKLLLLTFIFSLLSVLWMASTDNSLTYDDFTLLSEARFSSYSNLFHFLPTQSYNDRPLRMIFLKMLNDMFGLNYQIYHIIFIMIHLVNVYLVYKVSGYLFNIEKNKIGTEEKEYSSVIAAAIFGIYSPSLMAVSWISSTCDLQCVFFTLISILYYLKMRKEKQYRVFYGIISILFYYFSLRSKEMSLILPVLFVLYEIYISISMKNKFKISKIVIIQIGMMLSFTAILFAGGRSEMLPDNLYYQSFSLVILLRNAIRYLFLYFDWSNSGFLFNGYSTGAWLGVALFTITCVYSIWAMIRKKNYAVFLTILSVGISLAVVLPMVNIQHRLYLYFTSIFVGIMFATLFYQAISYSKCKYGFEITIFVIVGLWLVNFTPGQIEYRNDWISTCNRDQEQLIELQKKERPIAGSTIYVCGASDSYNIFFYGSGNSVRLIFDEPDYKIELVDEFPSNPLKPYVFWQFDGDHISEVARDSTNYAEIPPKIVSMYPEEINVSQVEEVCFIGVVPEKITENLKILVNGIEYNTTIGDEFISVAIPKDALNQDLKVQIVNKDNRSQSQILTITVQ